ncbi:12592_t:CDS:1, partial [Racocetra persica]
QSLLKTKIRYYQSISYSVIDSNGDYQYIKFRVGEVVETTLFDIRQAAFGIVKGIIEHI